MGWMWFVVVAVLVGGAPFVFVAARRALTELRSTTRSLHRLHDELDVAVADLRLESESFLEATRRFSSPNR